MYVIVILALWFFCVVVPCIRLYNSTIKPALDERAFRNLLKYGFWWYSDEVFELEKRDENIRKYIKIKKVYNAEYGYEPEKYVYTGVTVGGVTTGGIHKEDSYNYVSNVSNTGRYMLECGDKSFFKIKLSRDLLKEAKKSYINKYLDGNIIRVYGFNDDEKPECSDSAVKSAMNYLNTSDMRSFNALNAELKKGYPTYEKCNAILNWMCGE